MIVFLSLPTNGYTDDEIKEELAKMRKAVRSLYSTKTIIFSTNVYFSPNRDIRHERSYCLGEAIKKMSECDLVVFHPEWANANNCGIEYRVCNVYDIRYHVLDEEDME